MKRSKSKNKQNNRYKNLVKGKIFEVVIESLIKKAGFETDREKLKNVIGIKQLTHTKKRLHGRGSTYSPDIIGLFYLPIPFVYPILLIGEAKYYKNKVSIKTVREFLGAYLDVSQYPRINTKHRKFDKYEQIFYEERFTYAPVIFSSNGFNKKSQALMYVHGIYFISYENSPLFDKIIKNIEKILKNINFSEIEKEDLKFINNVQSLDSLTNIREDIKKEKYNEALNKLINLVESTYSYIGILDNLWIINFLSTKELKPTTKVKASHIELKNENFVQVRNSQKKRSKILGGFSLPTYFLKEYIRYGKKKGKKVLSSLVIYIVKDKKIFPSYVEFSEESRIKIIETLGSSRSDHSHLVEG